MPKCDFDKVAKRTASKCPYHSVQFLAAECPLKMIKNAIVIRNG